MLGLMRSRTKKKEKEKGMRTPVSASQYCSGEANCLEAVQAEGDEQGRTKIY